MGWESSATYYRVINEEIRSRFGGSRSAVCRLDSLDFAAIEPFVESREWDSLVEVLVCAALRLRRGGACILALCSNTAHIAADAISAIPDINFIHIADPVARLAIAARTRRIGMLATRPTLEQHFLAARWKDHFGLGVIEPTSVESDLLNELIYMRLLTGKADAGDSELLHRLAISLVDRGAEAIILACTDLSSRLDTGILPVPVFDSTDAHARAIAAAVRMER